MCEHDRKDKTGGQKSPGGDRTAEEDVKTAQPEQEREDRTQPEHDSID
jgi:hypothetical protein